jgi:hypothetical protein
MVLIDRIRDIILSKYVYNTYENGGVVDLTEEDVGASVNHVRINCPRQKTLVLKFDSSKGRAHNQLDISIYEKNIKYLTAICDYILFVSIKAKLHVIVINLKSKKNDNNLYQLRSGESISRFLVDSAIRTLYHDHPKDASVIKHSDVFYTRVLFKENPEDLSNSTLLSKTNLPYIELDGRVKFPYEIETLTSQRYIWTKSKPLKP